MISLTLPLFILAVAEAKTIRQRQLRPAASQTEASTSEVTGSYVSKDKAPLVNNTKEYYLGFRDADFKQPYAKYYNPVVVPLSDSLVNGLTGSPWPSAFSSFTSPHKPYHFARTKREPAYSAWEAHRYLEQPGYQNLENGWSISDNNTLMISTISDVPQVTGEQYDWWFSWHSVETARYKLWNPIAHQYAYRVPFSEDWTNTTYKQRYIGMTSFIDEYVGKDAAKISIKFVDPQTIGFSPTKWPELGIETVVVGKILIGKHTTSDFDSVSYIIHLLRRKPDGYRELRSRFFIAEDNHGSAQLGHDLAVHCYNEMTHLGSFLPAIYEEFKNSL